MTRSVRIKIIASMKTRETRSHYRFREDVAWREVGGAYHILTADSRYHCVEDEVGALILARLESAATLEDLVREVEARFEADRQEIRRDVRQFLSELVRKRVLARAPHSNG